MASIVNNVLGLKNIDARKNVWINSASASSISVTGKWLIETEFVLLYLTAGSNYEGVSQPILLFEFLA